MLTKALGWRLAGGPMVPGMTKPIGLPEPLTPTERHGSQIARGTGMAVVKDTGGVQGDV